MNTKSHFKHIHGSIIFVFSTITFISSRLSSDKTVSFTPNQQPLMVCKAIAVTILGVENLSFPEMLPQPQHKSDCRGKKRKKTMVPNSSYSQFSFFTTTAIVFALCPWSQRLGFCMATAHIHSSF